MASTTVNTKVFIRRLLRRPVVAEKSDLESHPVQIVEFERMAIGLLRDKNTIKTYRTFSDKVLREGPYLSKLLLLCLPRKP